MKGGGDVKAGVNVEGGGDVKGRRDVKAGVDAEGGGDVDAVFTVVLSYNKQGECGQCFDRSFRKSHFGEKKFTF